MKTEKEVKEQLKALERLDQDFGRSKLRDISERVLKWVLEERIEEKVEVVA